MLKRTKGRLLLTLLVITGLAGTIRDSSISQKERKSSINLMKDSRADILKAVKGLSAAQLNFKAAPDRWSVKECAYHIAITEKNLWNIFEAVMKAPANPEKRAAIKITDEQLIQAMEDRSNNAKAFEIAGPKKTPYKSLDEALDDFKTRRADHIKYMKSTTEDLRDHIVQMPFGWIDAYQLSLMIAAHSNRHKQQMDEVMADHNFPKK